MPDSRFCSRRISMWERISSSSSPSKRSRRKRKRSLRRSSLMAQRLHGVDRRRPIGREETRGGADESSQEERGGEARRVPRGHVRSEKTLEWTRGGERKRRPQGRPDPDQDEAVAHDQPYYGLPRGAERHPDADLRRA